MRSAPHPFGFRRAAARAPECLALVDPAGQRWTRRALQEEADRIANSLISRGLKRGDVVTVMAANSARYLALALAATQNGLVLTPINYRLTSDEAGFVIEDSGARVLFADVHAAEQGLAAVSRMSAGSVLVVGLDGCAGTLPYARFLDGAASTPPPFPMAGQLMNYTSGTTGRPRAVQRELCDASEEDSLLQLMQSAQANYGRSLDRGVFYMGSPLYHAAPLNWSLTALHMGHVVILASKWGAEEMLRLVTEERITWTHVVPTQFIRLLKLPQEIRSRYDLSSLECVIHAAAPCPVAVKHAMIEWLGPIVWEYYAATEGGGTIASPQDWLSRPGTVGRGMPGSDIRIYRADGTSCGANEAGEVYMRADPALTFEYKGDPEKTQAGRRDGYFTVGDVGYLDEDGFLFLCDRRSDMIISGGANIYPAEVEAALVAHPLVLDAAVFGVPDDEWGETVKAIVQLQPGLAQSETIRADIMAFLDFTSGADETAEDARLHRRPAARRQR